jgi:hypothetical protein
MAAPRPPIASDGSCGGCSGCCPAADASTLEELLAQSGLQQKGGDAFAPSSIELQTTQHTRLFVTSVRRWNAGLASSNCVAYTAVALFPVALLWVAVYSMAYVWRWCFGFLAQTSEHELKSPFTFEEVEYLFKMQAGDVVLRIRDVDMSDVRLKVNRRTRVGRGVYMTLRLTFEPGERTVSNPLGNGGPKQKS